MARDEQAMSAARLAEIHLQVSKVPDGKVSRFSDPASLMPAAYVVELLAEVERLLAREAALMAEAREAALTEVQEFVVAHTFDTTVGRKIDDFITSLLNARKE